MITSKREYTLKLNQSEDGNLVLTASITDGPDKIELDYFQIISSKIGEFAEAITLSVHTAAEVTKYHMKLDGEL
tara:strand:- start:18796 stop:19017 length:222 start_codon:yes stop_codon:yes gene_type:complete